MTRRDPDRVAAIVADYAAGTPTRKIKAKYGVSLSTIYLYATEAGHSRYAARQNGTKGYCTACTHVRTLNADRLCGTCASDVPLTGGRWVGRNGIQVWVEDGAA